MKPGEKVRVAAIDESLKETEMRMLIAQKYLNTRRAGITGVVMSKASIHNSALYYIQQSDGNIGAYLDKELERL